MKVVVLGSGGREHALAWKLSESHRVEQVYALPGNPGMKKDNIICFPWKKTEFKKLVDFCKNEDISYVVVGPEDLLDEGIVDYLTENNIMALGPTGFCAKIESSKIFAKEMMEQAKIPTANYLSFEEKTLELENLISEHDYNTPLVIKSSGLATGKGVGLCNSKEEALTFIERVKFPILIEEFLSGKEVSIFALCDGSEYCILGWGADAKRLKDHNKGPNTGGMGAYTPVNYFEKNHLEIIEQKVIRPLLDQFREIGHAYRGILYVGCVLTESGPKVLEFNARFGDPETQMLLPTIESDLNELFIKALSGDLRGAQVVHTNECSVHVVLAAEGYPEKKVAAEGIIDSSGPGKIFYAGVERIEGELRGLGGRILGVTALGENIEIARKNAYKHIEMLKFRGCQYRSDIGL